MVKGLQKQSNDFMRNVSTRLTGMKSQPAFSKRAGIFTSVKRAEKISQDRKFNRAQIIQMISCIGIGAINGSSSAAKLMKDCLSIRIFFPMHYQVH